MIFPDRLLWNGYDPIVLYRTLMDAFDGDPEPLLHGCQSEDVQIRNTYRKRVQQTTRPIFKTKTLEEAETKFLEFMRWVKDLQAEYYPLACIHWQPVDYRDVCGLWFNRNLTTYRQLWANFRALYLHENNLPLPIECYNALCSSPKEAVDWAFTEQADQVERQRTKDGGAGLLGRQ